MNETWFSVEASSLWLAVGAGVVAAVNPCGFALLPAYLSLFVLEDAPSSPTRAVVRALRATAALTAGFAGVFLLFGLVVSPVAGAVQAYLPAFTVVLGTALALVGTWVASGRSLPVARLGRSRASEGSPVVASWRVMTGFGASYALASLGCTIAPFLAVVVTSFRSSSPGAGMVLFAGYALGMGLTVGTAATAVALARRGVVTRMRRAGGVSSRVGGVVLALAGAYVAWYGAWELRVLHAGAGPDQVVEAAGNVQRWIADGVASAGLVGLGLLLAGLVTAAWGWRAVRDRRGGGEGLGSTSSSDQVSPSTAVSAGPARSVPEQLGDHPVRSPGSVEGAVRGVPPPR